jgi:hypothetical protein
MLVPKLVCGCKQSVLLVAAHEKLVGARNDVKAGLRYKTRQMEVEKAAKWLVESVASGALLLDTSWCQQSVLI